MNTHQLAIFTNIAKTGSFTKAAEIMSLTQPAVTQQIKLLEEELHIRLFDRIGKKILLSSEGKRLLPLAEDILVKMEEVIDIVKDTGGVLKGDLIAGASYTAGDYLLPSYIKKLKDLHPYIFMSVEVGNSTQIQEKVMGGKLDFGIIGNIVDNHQIICRPFMMDELVLISNPAYALPKKKKMDVCELVKFPFVVRDMYSGTWATVNSILNAHKIKLHSVLQAGSVESVKRAVAEGIGVSIISRVAVERDEKKGDLRVLTLNPPMKRNFCLIYNKGKYVNQLMRAFFDILGVSSRESIGSSRYDGSPPSG